MDVVVVLVILVVTTVMVRVMVSVRIRVSVDACVRGGRGGHRQRQVQVTGDVCINATARLGSLNL